MTCTIDDNTINIVAVIIIIIITIIIIKNTVSAPTIVNNSLVTSK